MSANINNLAKNSAIYISVEVVMRSVGFFLIPIYTRLLSPTDYGILTVVTSITSFLSVFYTMSLSNASIRLYFEDQKNDTFIRELWGTNITFVLIVSFSLSGFFFLAGEKVLHPFLGNVPFYPYLALGLITITTTQFFEMYQETLLARQFAKHYGIQNVFKFIFTVSFTILFVVILGMKAEGPLLANAIAGIILFIYTGVTFGRFIKWGIKFNILKEGLSYSLPLMPHGLSGFAMTMLDRIFINKYQSIAAAGIYNIGYAFGIILNLVTAGFNEAFAPYFMKIMKNKNKSEMKQASNIGLSVIGIYILLAVIISLFSKEVLYLMTTKSYYDGWKVTPFIVFSNVFQGIYRFFSAPLFFNLHGTKFISFGTFISAGLNIGLLFILVPKYGMIGAGMASVIANLLIVIIIGIIAHLIESFDWAYKKIGVITLFGIIGTFLILNMGEKGILFNNFYYKSVAAMLLSLLILYFSNDGLRGLKSKLVILKNMSSMGGYGG